MLRATLPAMTLFGEMVLCMSKITTNTDANIKDQDKNTCVVSPKFMECDLNGIYDEQEALIMAEMTIHFIMLVASLLALLFVDYHTK